MSSDEALLRRARALDRPALTEIYDTHNEGLYYYALRLCGDESLAEDCVTEVFSRVLRAFKEDRGPLSNLKSYLYQTAHNWVMDQFRRRSQTVPLDDGMADESAPDLLDDAARRIAGDRVRRAFATLTEEQQRVVALKFVAGWDNEAVAEALNKPLGAVKSLQHRALGALRRALQGDAQVHGHAD